MRKMLNDLIFKERGYAPYGYRLSWPQNPDDEHLIVFVQWEEGEPIESIPLRIELFSD